MILDVPTLMIAGGFVSVMCGALLVFAWWQYRETAAPLWWAASDFTLGIALVLLAIGFIAGAVPLFLAGLTLLVVAPALAWAAARVFRGRKARLPILLAGTIAWLVIAGARPLHGVDAALPIGNALIAAGYGVAAALELARGRHERLPARLPLIALLVLHAAMILFAIPAALGGLVLEPPPIASLFGAVHFETLIYVVGTALFFVAMMKERSESRHRSDAETDALTGLPNRRAFLHIAERMAGRCRRDGVPFVVAAFDLDRFKNVNDTHGHAIGDRALRIFAESASGSLRPNDVVGRVGGEEFSAILPGADIVSGRATAERVRLAFAEAARTIEGRELNATVSVGISVSDAAEIPLAVLMEAADAALYRAKLNGRDRVESAVTERPAKAYPHLVRVA